MEAIFGMPLAIAGFIDLLEASRSMLRRLLNPAERINYRGPTPKLGVAMDGKRSSGFPGEIAPFFRYASPPIRISIKPPFRSLPGRFFRGGFPRGSRANGL
jgi:hypothetical protein